MEHASVRSWFRRHLPALAAGVALVTVAAVPVRAAQDAPFPLESCTDSAVARQLDFWVGDWQAVGADGQPVGVNRVRKLHGGCVIEENWTSAKSGVTGQSMNYVDPRDGRWKQVWFDSSGTLVTYDGELRDGAMRFEGQTVEADGTAVVARAVVEPVGGGRLHHAIEHSKDGGESWEVVFEATYVPLSRLAAKAEAGSDAEPPEAPPAERALVAPVPPASTAPAPEAPVPAKVREPVGVRAASGAVPEERVPIDERPRVHLESPMVLEVPIGPIESIPESYSWSTDETSVYVAGGVSVRRVTIARSERRGSVRVEATAALHGSQYLQHAALAADLVWRGEVVDSAAVGEFPVGRSIKAQSDGDGLRKTLTLSLDRERFEEIFGAGDERPVLRLTVTVRN